MAQITFTRNLARHVACPELVVAGRTVREALEGYFALHPRVRGYVLDDQGALRKHVVIFVDGQQLRDRAGLSEPVQDGTSIHVMQALSGG
ncbi:MoaD/ThiS family protein [Sorangium sp. So ce1036]|uniref:MoaD/ThiS family protein n=1 Tax=Sorangium sp. So ce1036 TaxID=3133328 RepID=UPI003F0E425E